jgi:hypothetical protein
MKFTLIFIGLLAFNAVPSRCGTKEFDFGFFKGVVEGFGRINGTETENNDEMSSKAEQAIRRIVEKHLGNKKKNKAQKLGLKREVPEISASSQKAEIPAQNMQQIPQSINWDEHQEARDLINKKVTGGTQAINDLISLIKEREEQNDKTN